MGGCNGGVSGRDRNLVQIRYDIAGRIQSCHGSALMRVDYQSPDLGYGRSQPGSQAGTNIATQSRIYHVKMQDPISYRGANPAALQVEPVDRTFNSEVVLGRFRLDRALVSP